MTDPDPLNRFLFRPTNWLGLGTDTEETDYLGYARQRITLTAQIRFPRLLGFLNEDITHMQEKNAGHRRVVASTAAFRRRFGDPAEYAVLLIWDCPSFLPDGVCPSF